MKLARILYALLAFSIPSLSQGDGGDWPEWRGPNRDGVSSETGLLKSWPKEGPPLAWRTNGIGDGYSSVSVADGRVFTMGDKGGSSFVIALNETDGKVIWSAKVGKAGAPGWGDFRGPRSTPTVDAGLVFALGQYGDLVCVDAKTGKERWRKNYSDDFGAGLPEWGHSESPIVDGDKVVCTPGGPRGAMVALDKKTGKVLWQSKGLVDEAAYGSPIIVELGGRRQYVQLTPETLAGVAAETGEVLWQTERKGETAVIPTPISRDNGIYVTSGYGVGCVAFEITSAAGKFNAKQLYKNKVMVNKQGGVVRHGNYLYGYSDGKGWVCQDFTTGKMVWREKEKLGKGSLTSADGHLYLRAEEGDGTVALIAVTPDGYKEKSRFDPPEKSGKEMFSHPVVAGGKLYLRDHDLLLCYDVKAK